jgi:hypothetical protein
MNFSEIEMWHAMALIFYSISFICSSVVKVMLLHRLRSDSPRSAFKSSASLCLQRSSQPILKMLIVIVAICCGTNLVASCFAAAKYIHNASELELLASQPPAIIAYFSRAAESVIIAVACLVVVTLRIASSRHEETKGQQALLNAGKAAGAVVVLITLTRACLRSQAPQGSSTATWRTWRGVLFGILSMLQRVSERSFLRSVFTSLSRSC